jgi:protein-arginine kinase activator protein McsA
MIKKQNEKIEAKCPSCRYSWGTKSKLKNVTCPSCLKKFIPESPELKGGELQKSPA